ncbi:MAG: hypothetical protein ACFCVF_15880 [Kineosporiaceae bacterium]
MAALTADRRLLAIGGLLGVVSLGLPWGVRGAEVLDAGLPFVSPVPVGGTTWFFPDTIDLEVAVPVVVHGVEHPVRVLAVVAGLLVWWAVRRGSPGTAWLGLAVAATALPMGGFAGAGRVVLAAGVLVVAVALLGTTTGRSAGPQPQPAARLR